MRFLPKDSNINFMRLRGGAVVLSTVLLLGTAASLVLNGLNFSVEFTGGTLVELAFDRDVDIDAVRSSLEASELGEAQVQLIDSGRKASVRLPATADDSDADVRSRVLAVLGDAEVRSVEFVGPAVGEELREQGGLSVVFALLFIMAYILVRFTFKFSVGAVAALFHDVLIVLGVFSALQLKFDLSVLGAILAVIGYSLNDTIVVFDRVRENFRKLRKGGPVDVVNTSLNQTLARTLMTSITTLIVLLALFFLGGDGVHAFATALIIGVVVGTYSSIYVASTAALALGVNREDLIPVVREDEAEIKARP